MPIKVGDRLPDVKFRVMCTEGPVWKTTDEVFKGRKVALFASRTFHSNVRRPSYSKLSEQAHTIKAKGVHTIAVTGVDERVRSWKPGRKQQQQNQFSATATVNSPKPSTWPSTAGNASRHPSKRYSMLVSGVVKKLNIEVRPASANFAAARLCSRSFDQIYNPGSRGVKPRPSTILSHCAQSRRPAPLRFTRKFVRTLVHRVTAVTFTQCQCTL